MHEQVYVNDIVAAASKHGVVESIVVEVGELAPISAAELGESLRFTGWKVTIVPKHGAVHCNCGFNGRPVITEKGHDYTMFHCPKCGAQFPRITDGKDILVKEILVKE